MVFCDIIMVMSIGFTHRSQRNGVLTIIRDSNYESLEAGRGNQTHYWLEDADVSSASENSTATGVIQRCVEASVCYWAGASLFKEYL